MADAVLIMQYISNPNRFGLNGTDEHHMTQEGLDNSDVDGKNNGVTNSDAVSIQKYLLGVVEGLPEK